MYLEGTVHFMVFYKFEQLGQQWLINNQEVNFVLLGVTTL